MTYLNATILNNIFQLILISENVETISLDLLEKLQRDSDIFKLCADDFGATKGVLLSQFGHKITRPDGSVEVELLPRDKRDYLEALKAFGDMDIDDEVELLTEEEFAELKEKVSFQDDVWENFYNLAVERLPKVDLEMPRKNRGRNRSTN